MRRSILLAGLLSAALTAGLAAQPMPPRGAQYQQGQGPNGEDGQQEPPMTPEQQASMAAIARYQHSLEASLRSSSSPRDWALSVQIMHADDKEGPDPADAARGDLLRKAAEAAPKDRVVQWTWAVAPPELSGCTAARPCKNRGSALARLEPDNGAAWVPAVIDALRFHNQAGIDDALAHMAAATRYDEVFHDAMSAWMDAFRRYPVPADTMRGQDGKDVDPMLAALTAAVAQVSSITPSYQELIQACQRNPKAQPAANLSANCAKAGRLMFEQSTTIIGRMVGGDLLRTSAPQDAAFRERIRTLQWQLEQHMKLAQAGENNPARMRAQAELLLSSESEVAAMQEGLRRANVSLTPPAGWKPTQQQNGPGGPQGGPQGGMPEDSDPNGYPGR